MTALSSFSPSHRSSPRKPASSDNYGSFVNVVSWILLITSALAVLTRLATKRALRRRIDIDDAFVIAALVSTGLVLRFLMRTYMLTIWRQIVSIGSGASVSVQTANGLGRDIWILSDDQIIAYQKVRFSWQCQVIVV